MIKKSLLFPLFLGTSLLAGSINIAVAANVSYAIDDLKVAFKKNNPNTKVRVTLGSSGKLTAQIKNGAPYTLFMSANMKYPQALYDAKVATTKPIVYAQGALAYLSKKERDFTNPHTLLHSDKIRRIAIANPKTAPYGKATKEAFMKMNIYESLKHKFIFGESISQTVSYTVTAADIGVIAKSSLYSSRMSHFKEGVNWADLKASSYTPIQQGIVILKNGAKNTEVQAFYDFVLSDEAKEIFKRFGYIID